MANKVGVIITNDKVYGFYNETICFEEKHNLILDKYSIEDMVGYGNDQLWEIIKNARSCVFGYALNWGGCRLVEKIENINFNRDELFEYLNKIV